VRLIDTAGMRKQARVQDKLEKLSVADARRAVDFAEVVVLLLDATLGLEAQDLKIADNVLREGRALIIAINKWDVAQDQSALFQGISRASGEGLAQAPDVSLLAVSGKTGKGLDQLLEAAFTIRDTWSKRVPTGELNRWFAEAVERNPPPAPRRAHQVALHHPGECTTSDLRAVRHADRPAGRELRRYLMNSLRKEFGFGAVPIRLQTRAPRNPFTA
jgi:GTP-binding protein